MLSPYRVLDCTDDKGHLAGLVLAQLGAEVILVEPPGGAAGRHRPPYAGDRAGPERALWHWAYNRGKRSVVVDQATESGRAALAELAAGADVLLWSGRADEQPPDLAALTAANPHLVVVLMTPFGLDGPKAGWAESDLVVCASACQAALVGDAELPPLRWGSTQGYLHGAADMAVAALIGLTERARSGLGQVADVSGQASCLQGSFCYSLNAAWQAPLMRRCGDGLDLGTYRLRWTYPAADGEVSITMVFGTAMKDFIANLFRWVWEEGLCDEATRDLPWEDLGVQLSSGEVPAAEADRLCGLVAQLTARHTKAELYEQATKRRVMLAPIATPTEVMSDTHLAGRSYWDQVDHPLAAHRAPGRFVVASATPLASLGPAPELGADAAAVLGVARRPAVGAAAEAAATVAPPTAPPFEGLKVLDLTWSVAGPYVGRTLADFGATVVKVETHRRPDLGRTTVPFHPRNDEFPLEGGGLFANSNAGKLGLELDLATEAGAEVLWDLVRWADVVAESFSKGALERMGFGYERMRQVNPGVILLSSCLGGQTSTLELPGLGNLITALFGFTVTTGWPGRPAAGPFGAYTDVVSPRFGLAALLAALDHRRRTGEGQHLDLSQAEASLHFLTTALLDAEVNGREFEPLGNDDLVFAPHGVYPATGEDRWVAVACTDDGEWRALAGLLGRDDLAGLGRAERFERRRELDELVAAWTSGREAEAAQDELQAAGVPAHQVQNSHECLADPQLAHRGMFVTVEHPLLGPILLEGPRILLSRTPGATVHAGPTYGQHNEHVLGDLLGYDAERIGELVVAGALG